MRKMIQNEKGLTLVELLAVFAVGTVVLILMGGIIVSIQKQYNEQSTQTGNLFDVTYAAKVITKDARKATYASTDDHTLELGDTTYTFIPDKQTIERNGDPLVKSIKEFHAEIVSDPNKNSQLKLKIVSLSNKKLETTITIRSGD